MAPRDGRAVLRAVWLSMVAHDLGRARPWSALRRTAVVVATMAVVWSLAGPQAVASVGMAAMLVGFLDRQQSPRRAIRVMSAGTMALAGTQLLANLLGPWPVLILVLVVVIAFAEGASTGLDPDAPIIAHFCGTIAATAAVTGSHAGPVGATAAAVLAAGAVQTALTALSGRLVPKVREFGLVAAELELIALALDRIAESPDPLRPDPAARERQEAASRRMTATQRDIGRSDLSAHLVELLTLVLWAADQVRIEARALALHGNAGTAPAPAPDQVGLPLPEQLHATAATLRAGARVLQLHGRERAQAVALLLDAPGDQWLAGPRPAASRADFVAGIVQLAREEPVRVGPVSRRGVPVAVAAALVPGGLPFRLGARIAGAALLAMLSATWLGIAHASWASNSVLSMLRPDGGATLPRIALRALAVSGAALTVVGVALAGDGRRSWLLVAMALAIYAGYWLGPVNYGVFGFAITVAVLMVLAATGADPLEIALARWLDTLVGCAVALLAAFLVPVWGIQAMPATVAGAAGALADWLASIGRAAGQPPEMRNPDAVRRAGAQLRDRVSDCVAVFALARLEPAGAIPVAQLRLVLANLRASGQAALAAEHLLALGAVAPAPAAAIAVQAAEVAAEVASAVQGAATDPPAAGSGAELRVAPSPDGGAGSAGAVTQPAAAEDEIVRALTASLGYLLDAAAVISPSPRAGAAGQ